MSREEKYLEEAIRTALVKILQERYNQTNVKGKHIQFSRDVLKKGYNRRTECHILRVSAPAELTLFCKEYVQEGVSQDLAGNTRPDINEVWFYETLGRIGGFVPECLGYERYAEEGRKEFDMHHLIFAERYEHTLEEKLWELHKKKDDALAKGDDEVERVESEAGDWLRRFSDIAMVNNYLLNEKCRIEDLKRRVRQLDEIQFADDLIKYFDSFLEKIIPQEKERRRWVVQYRRDKIVGSLIEEVAGIIAKNSGKGVSFFGPYPAHCLYKENVKLSEPEYKCGESLLQIRDGKKPNVITPHSGLAICDFTKLGMYSPLLGLAALFTDPSVTLVLPNDKIKPKVETQRDEGGLLDHLIVSEKRIKGDRDYSLYDIPREDQRRFLEVYTSASVWALLRKLYFIASLEPERRKELTEARPLYQPETFARLCIKGIIDLYDPTDRFKELKEGLKDLEKALNMNPLSQD